MTAKKKQQRSKQQQQKQEASSRKHFFFFSRFRLSGPIIVCLPEYLLSSGLLKPDAAGKWKHTQSIPGTYHRRPVAPVAYQVIFEPGIGQFREFEPRRVHTRITSWGLLLVHKLTCGKRESVS